MVTKALVFTMFLFNLLECFPHEFYIVEEYAREALCMMMQISCVVGLLVIEFTS